MDAGINGARAVIVRPDGNIAVAHAAGLNIGGPRYSLKMQALVAVMRKLLHAIFGMFKHHQLYDGSKVFRLPGAHNPFASGKDSKEAA